VLLVVVLLIAVCSAHVCLLNPMQRGRNPDVNTEASNDCFKLKAPCGDNTPRPPVEIVRSGFNYTVVFQKNLNHWSASKQGNLQINFAKSPDGPFIKLAEIADTNSPSLTVYLQSIRFPHTLTALDHAVIQVVYDPGTVGPFYQCGDVSIIP